MLKQFQQNSKFQKAFLQNSKALDGYRGKYEEQAYHRGIGSDKFDDQFDLIRRLQILQKQYSEYMNSIWYKLQ